MNAEILGAKLAFAPLLLTSYLINRARDLYREISDRGLFVQTKPVGRGLYKKSEVRYFSVKTEQARLIKSLLYGIRHLYLKKTGHDGPPSITGK